MSLCLPISADTDLCIRPYDVGKVGVKNIYNTGTSHPLEVRVKGLIKRDLIAVNTISAFLSVEVSCIVVAFMLCIIILFL